MAVQVIVPVARAGSRAVRAGLRVSFRIARVVFLADNVVIAAFSAQDEVHDEFGKRVERRIKRSMKRRPGPSPPGQPPHVHTGILKRNIAYDSKAGPRGSVVVGPKLTDQRQTNAGQTVPRALEQGGPTTVKIDQVRRKVRIRARPYVGPAFEKELPNAPELWRNSIR